jgi:LysR family transcriptional regulator, mexEF-oprN operon transcriptional activator
MNEIDLRRFDFNLMVVFEVLMAERNVTRAAERLGRTQRGCCRYRCRLHVKDAARARISGGINLRPDP